MKKCIKQLYSNGLLLVKHFHIIIISISNRCVTWPSPMDTKLWSLTVAVIMDAHSAQPSYSRMVILMTFVKPFDTSVIVSPRLDYLPQLKAQVLDFCFPTLASVVHRATSQQQAASPLCFACRTGLKLGAHGFGSQHYSCIKRCI